MDRRMLERLRDRMHMRDWNQVTVGPAELYALLDALLAEAPEPAWGAAWEAMQADARGPHARWLDAARNWSA